LNRKVNSGHIYLEKYKEIYAIYQQATRLMKENNFDSAELMLREIFVDYEHLQIPIEIYKAYILLLLSNEKRKEAERFLASSPEDIQSSVEIIQLIQKYSLNIESNKKRKLPFSLQKASKIIGVCVVIGGVVFLGSYFLKDLSTKENSTVKEQKLHKQVSDLTEKNNKINNELKKANDKIKAGPVSTQPVNKKEEPPSIQLDLSNDAIKAYKKGYELFKQKNYKEAKHQFALSYSLHQTNYLSDDTLYFLIKTEQIISHKMPSSYIDEFLSQSNPYFTKSPYIDEIMLMKAEVLLSEKKNSDALDLLHKIQKNYPHAWTADRATYLEKHITNN
jgi:TolA-binding protein